MAAGDLCTVDQVKDFLGLTQAKDDDLLTRLVSAASAAILNEARRDFASASYVDIVDGTGGRSIPFRQYPVTAVASVGVIYSPGAAAVALSATTDYRWDAFRVALVNGERFPQGFGNVVLTYTAGYATIPADLVDAAVKLTAWRYKERDRVGQVSKVIAGENIVFSTKAIPPDVMETINEYRRVAPFI